MSDFYILENRIPIKVQDIKVWGEWMEDASHRRVALTEIDGTFISTVFLGLNHNFSSAGEPILFETMTFIEGQGEWQERCATYDQAEAMHQAMCDKVNQHLKASASVVGRIINYFRQIK